VVPQVGGDGEFPAVEGRITDPVQTLIGDDLQRHIVAARTRDDDPGFADLHS